jgi:hypothetical protein
MEYTIRGICNLANKIQFEKDWNPLINYAPSQYLIPAKALLDASIPFAEDAELIVEIPSMRHQRCLHQ